MLASPCETTRLEAERRHVAELAHDVAHHGELLRALDLRVGIAERLHAEA
jgi:hypothetical protein